MPVCDFRTSIVKIAAAIVAVATLLATFFVSMPQKKANAISQSDISLDKTPSTSSYDGDKFNLSWNINLLNNTHQVQSGLVFHENLASNASIQDVSVSYDKQISFVKGLGSPSSGIVTGPDGTYKVSLNQQCNPNNGSITNSACATVLSEIKDAGGNSIITPANDTKAILFGMPQNAGTSVLSNQNGTWYIDASNNATSLTGISGEMTVYTGTSGNDALVSDGSSATYSISGASAHRISNVGGAQKLTGDNPNSTGAFILDTAGNLYLYSSGSAHQITQDSNGNPISASFTHVTGSKPTDSTVGPGNFNDGGLASDSSNKLWLITVVGGVIKADRVTNGVNIQGNILDLAGATPGYLDTEDFGSGLIATDQGLYKLRMYNSSNSSNTPTIYQIQTDTSGNIIPGGLSILDKSNVTGGAFLLYNNHSAYMVDSTLPVWNVANAGGNGGNSAVGYSDANTLKAITYMSDGSQVPTYYSYTKNSTNASPVTLSGNGFNNTSYIANSADPGQGAFINDSKGSWAFLGLNNGAPAYNITNADSSQGAKASIRLTVRKTMTLSSNATTLRTDQTGQATSNDTVYSLPDYTDAIGSRMTVQVKATVLGLTTPQAVMNQAYVLSSSEANPYGGLTSVTSQQISNGLNGSTSAGSVTQQEVSSSQSGTQFFTNPTGCPGISANGGASPSSGAIGCDTMVTYLAGDSSLGPNMNVNYNPNGGMNSDGSTGTAISQTGRVGGFINILGNPYNRAGYFFTNWLNNTSGVSYTPGEQFTGFGNMDLYAQWVALNVDVAKKVTNVQYDSTRHKYNIEWDVSVTNNSTQDIPAGQVIHDVTNSSVTDVTSTLEYWKRQPILSRITASTGTGRPGIVPVGGGVLASGGFMVGGPDGTWIIKGIDSSGNPIILPVCYPNTSDIIKNATTMTGDQPAGNTSGNGFGAIVGTDKGAWLVTDVDSNNNVHVTSLNASDGVANGVTGSIVTSSGAQPVYYNRTHNGGRGAVIGGPDGAWIISRTSAGSVEKVISGVSITVSTGANPARPSNSTEEDAGGAVIGGPTGAWLINGNSTVPHQLISGHNITSISGLGPDTKGYGAIIGSSDGAWIVNGNNGTYDVVQVSSNSIATTTGAQPANSSYGSFIGGTEGGWTVAYNSTQRTAIVTSVNVNHAITKSGGFEPLRSGAVFGGQDGAWLVTWGFVQSLKARDGMANGFTGSLQTVSGLFPDYTNFGMVLGGSDGAWVLNNSGGFHLTKLATNGPISSTTGDYPANYPGASGTLGNSSGYGSATMAGSAGAWLANATGSTINITPLISIPLKVNHTDSAAAATGKDVTTQTQKTAGFTQRDFGLITTNQLPTIISGTAYPTTLHISGYVDTLNEAQGIINQAWFGQNPPDLPTIPSAQAAQSKIQTLSGSSGSSNDFPPTAGSVPSYAKQSLGDCTPNAMCSQTISYLPTDTQRVTIHFDSNGSGTTGSISDQNAIINSSITLSSNQYSRPGFGFVGWALNADGTGQTFSDGSPLTVTQSMVNNGTITLYAQWVQDVSVLPFTGGSGTFNFVWILVSLAAATVTLSVISRRKISQ